MREHLQQQHLPEAQVSNNVVDDDNGEEDGKFSAFDNHEEQQPDELLNDGGEAENIKPQGLFGSQYRALNGDGLLLLLSQPMLIVSILTDLNSQKNTKAINNTSHTTF